MDRPSDHALSVGVASSAMVTDFTSGNTVVVLTGVTWAVIEGAGGGGGGGGGGAANAASNGGGGGGGSQGGSLIVPVVAGETLTVVVGAGGTAGPGAGARPRHGYLCHLHRAQGIKTYDATPVHPRYAACRIASSVTSSIPACAPANPRRSSRQSAITPAGLHIAWRPTKFASRSTPYSPSSPCASDRPSV